MTDPAAAPCSECGHDKALHPFSDSGRPCTHRLCVCSGYKPPADPVAANTATRKPTKPRYVRSGNVIDEIRAIAREHGYAVGVHGSMRRERDIDLIAAPWAKPCHSPRTLMRAINELPYLSRVKEHDNDKPKPYGRLGFVWIITHRGIECPAYVDLSVMPRG